MAQPGDHGFDGRSRGLGCGIAPKSGAGARNDRFFGRASGVNHQHHGHGHAEHQTCGGHTAEKSFGTVGAGQPPLHGGTGDPGCRLVHGLSVRSRRLIRNRWSRPVGTALAVWKHPVDVDIEIAGAHRLIHGNVGSASRRAGGPLVT